MPDLLNLPPPPLEIPILDGKVMPNRWQQFFLAIRRIAVALDSLADLAAQTGTGYAARISSAGAWALRTFQGGSFITLTNAAGIAGNTTIALSPASTESVLLGRGQGSGAGNFQEISLGSGLTMTGTTLSSTGSVTIAQVAARIALGI